MFFNFGIKDIIDIVLVALMLYYLYRLMKESRSLNIFIGIMFFVLIWLMVSQVFEMRLLGGILDKLISVGVITLIILFQEEIRKFLYSLGAHQRVRGVMNFFYKNDNKDKEDKETIIPIVMACMSMARGKVGALIVIERGEPLDDIVDTGCILRVSHNQDIPRSLGLRHRAAMGISQSSDAMAVIVSEETGNISVAIEGKFRLRLSAEELESILTEEGFR